jgi:hypothetical protein
MKKAPATNRARGFHDARGALVAIVSAVAVNAYSIGLLNRDTIAVANSRGNTHIHGFYLSNR